MKERQTIELTPAGGRENTRKALKQGIYITNNEKHRRRDRRYNQQSCSRSPNAAGVNKLVIGAKVIVTISERYRASVDYRSYRLTQESWKYNEDGALQIHNLRKKIAVCMNDHSFSGNHSIADINALAEFKRSCD